MQTAELLDQAIATGTPLAEISRALGLKPNTLSVAKHAGKLSPALAAALADYLGEPAHQWLLAAVMEGERSAPLRRRLMPLMKATRSYVSMVLRRLRDATAPTRTREFRTVVGCTPKRRAISG